MDYNKGRFVPDTYPLSMFSEDGARTPFEGEVCIDDNNDIYYWKQNSTTNVWEKHSRTKDIQDYLDGYEEDTTFPAAKAFISNEILHRMFYDHENMKLWIDGSVSVSEYVYYAVKSISKINGKQRYVTGTEPNDGLENTFALFKLGDKATTIFPISASTWYAVEFYDEDKDLRSTINFMSYQCKNMPIEKNLRQNEAKTVNGNLIRLMDNRIIDFSVRFNQSLGENKGFIYKNQPISVLKASVIKKMADGHRCYSNMDIYPMPITISNSTGESITLNSYIESIGTPETEGRIFKAWSTDGKTYSTLEELNSVVNPGESKVIYALMESEESADNRISLYGFDKIDNTVLGDYECYVNYTYIKTNGETKKYKIDVEQVVVVDNNDVSIDIENENSNREYVSVYVEQIGDASYNTEIEYEFTSADGIDTITIPRSYFGFGRNIVKIIYSESNKEPLVKVDDLTIPIKVTVTVKEDDYRKIDKFIPAGYITNPSRGLYVLNMKYFAHYDDGILEDVTEKVIPLVAPKSSFGELQSCKVKIQLDRLGLVFNTYDFTVYCTDPSISGNNSRVVINGTQASRILFYNGTSFALGLFESDNTQVKTTIDELLSSNALRFNGHSPTHIKVVEVEDFSKAYTDIVDNEDNLIYIQKLKIPMYISPKQDITLGQIIDELSDTSITSVNDYSFNYSSATGVGIGNYNNYSFQYFSINGGNSEVTSVDRNIICKKDKLISFDVDGVKTFPMEVHTKNVSIFSVSKDKPFLVEGYYKDENGKYVCTGCIVHYAQSQS